MAKKPADIPIFPSGTLVRVAAFDPGSKKLGAAVIEYRRQRLAIYNPEVSLLDARLFKSSKRNIDDRLEAMAPAIASFIDENEPDIVVLERPVVGKHKNYHSALNLGITHGVIQGIVLGYGLPVCKFFPATIKKVAGGHGQATKDRLAAILAETFTIPDNLIDEPDVTDAIAIAYTYALMSDSAP